MFSHRRNQNAENGIVLDMKYVVYEDKQSLDTKATAKFFHFKV